MRLNRVAWIVVVLGGLTALSSILASIFGAQAILLAVGSTIFTIAAIPMARKLQDRQNDKSLAEMRRRRQQEQLGRRQREQLERQQQSEREHQKSRLDGDCAELLRRAEAAVNAILSSNACVEHLLNPPVDQKQLRDNILAISSAAHEITDLRAELKSIGADSLTKARAPEVDRPQLTNLGLGDLMSGVFSDRRPSGTLRLGDVPSNRPSRVEGNEIAAAPMTADAIKPGQQALAIALKSLQSRLLKLERYASSVRKVDATYRDWMGTQKAERLNPRFRELIARTAQDELEAKELDRLAKRAAEAEQAFCESINEAHLLGEILALPDDKGSND